MYKSEGKFLSQFCWVAMAGLSLAAFFIYLKYINYSAAVKISFWLVWLLITVGMFSMTNLGKLAWQYVLESRDELRKVHWPSRKETMQTTVIIAVFVFTISIILWLVDNSMLWLVGKLTNLHR